MSRRFLVLAVPALLVAGACAPLPATKARFDAFGEYVPGKTTAPVVSNAAEVRVFYGSAPDGFSYRDQVLDVEPGYQHEVLGTVKVEWTDERTCMATKAMDGTMTPALTKRDVLERMKSAAQEQGGNAVIFATSQVSDAPADDELCDLVKKYEKHLGFGWIVVLGSAPPAPSPAAAPAAPEAAAPVAPAPAATP